MNLTNVSVLNAPVEEWREGAASCDLVTSRNVAPLNVMVEWAAPLVAPEGLAVLWTRRLEPAAEADAAVAAQQTGLRPVEIRSLDPRRHLHIFTKVDDTPPQFPRPRKVSRNLPIRAT